MPAKTIAVWDPFVRVFHWSIALGFLLNMTLLEEGETFHEWVGYAMLALVGLRIIWGFIGPIRARFSNFFPTPKRVQHHLQAIKTGQHDASEGHNPLGGAMVITLMLMLLVVGFSGWMQTWDAYWGEEWLEELHEIAANITLGLVAIHVAAVIIMGRFTGIPLIRPMLTGKRTVTDNATTDHSHLEQKS